MISTVERARGRWLQILPKFGIPSEFLINKHGPCPLCGGRDRFRFDDKDGSGSYYCHQCGAGVGLILLRKKNGWDHITACQEVDEFLGVTTSETRETFPNKPAPSTTNKVKAIQRLLDEATSTVVMGAYLTKRGISARSAVLRGHRACPYFDDKGVLIGRYPAVVAPIIGPAGALESAVRIYDAALDPRKKIMPPVTTINGAAVRLHDPVDGVLGIAEGVETALGAYELFGIPTWAALSDIGLMAFEPPAETSVLRIFGDNDSNYVGQAAAYVLAKKTYANAMKQGRKVTVEVCIPDNVDTDWLDVLNRQAKP